MVNFRYVSFHIYSHIYEALRFVIPFPSLTNMLCSLSQLIRFPLEIQQQQQKPKLRHWVKVCSVYWFFFQRVYGLVFYWFCWLFLLPLLFHFINFCSCDHYFLPSVKYDLLYWFLIFYGGPKAKDLGTLFFSI